MRIIFATDSGISVKIVLTDITTSVFAEFDGDVGSCCPVSILTRGSLEGVVGKGVCVCTNTGYFTPLQELNQPVLGLCPS